MSTQYMLHFGRSQVLAATVDDILLATHEIKEASFILPAEVTVRSQPSGMTSFVASGRLR